MTDNTETKETKENTVPRFVALHSRAEMPSSCWYSWNYQNVAIMQTNQTKMPQKIQDSSFAKIIKNWNKLYNGSTERCAFWRKWKYATQLCKELNEMEESEIISRLKEEGIHYYSHYAKEGLYRPEKE